MATIRGLRAGLLDQEVDLLKRCGYTVSRSEDAGGVWELDVIAPPEKSGVGEISLNITLPASYPLLPPIVSTGSISLAHHQNPITGVLCLIERSTKNWIPEWHVAGLLDNQLQAVISAGLAPAGQGAREFEQGEPASAYLEYLQSASVLIDTELASSPVGTHGEFEMKHIAISNAALIGYVGPGQEVRTLGVISRMYSPGHEFYRAPERLNNVLASHTASTFLGRWTLLTETPAISSAEALWELASETDARHATKYGNPGGTSQFAWRAVGFPEEHARGVFGTGWIFLQKIEQVAPLNRADRRRGGNPGRSRNVTRVVYPVRASRAGQSDLTFRAPESLGLDVKRVLVIGCGAIGSVAIEHLARAGVGNFTLIDSDILEPGNLSRHAGDFQIIGVNKAVAMAQRIAQINPYASVRAVPLHLGTPYPHDGKTEDQWLRELCTDADMVVDATAETGVQQYTSLVAREVGRPWVRLDATPGIGGGTVVRIDQESEFCYGCFLWHQYESSIPSPVSVDSALVQPAGCTSPTFTGTGFDLAMISLQATRVVVGALLRGTDGAYPEDGYDAHILTLRDKDGAACPPAWQGIKLGRSMTCPDH